MGESENKTFQTPGHSHLSPSMCHYFLFSSWHSAGHSWSSRQGRNQSTISLLHSHFRSCWLSASGLARNVLKIHQWNNKVWVPCKERKIYKTWQLMSECRCVCVYVIPTAVVFDRNPRVGQCAICHSRVLRLKCCASADCLKPLRWDNSTTVAMVTRTWRSLTAQHSLTASPLH